MEGTPSRDADTPFTVALRLEPRADAAAIARRFVHDHRDHIDGDVVENAELLVAEIVTSALEHGAGDLVLTMRVEPPGIGVRVTDTGQGLGPSSGETVWFDVRPEE